MCLMSDENAADSVAATAPTSLTYEHFLNVHNAKGADRQRRFIQKKPAQKVRCFPEYILHIFSSVIGGSPG